MGYSRREQNGELVEWNKKPRQMEWESERNGMGFSTRRRAKWNQLGRGNELGIAGMNWDYRRRNQLEWSGD